MSSFGHLRLSDDFGLEFQACKLLSVSWGMLTVLDLVWTHDGLSVTFGRSRGVSCLANNSLFPLSLTTLTTLSFGTDWYVIMALGLVCQNSRPASCAVDMWIQYTASCSGLKWLWYCTFLGFLDQEEWRRFCAFLLYVPFVLPPIQLLLWSIGLVLDPRDKWILSTCKESSRNSSILVIWSLHLSDPGSHECISILHLHLSDFKPCLDASKIEAMEPILVCKIFFRLTSESSFQYRMYNGFPMHVETHIIEVFFSFAQRGTVVHNVRVVTMNFIHKSFVTTTYQKTIRSILVNSVMVLALQYQEHQKLKESQY